MPAQIGTDAAEAARRLTAGELVGLPTETVYGLGANGLDTLAVADVFTVKGRPRFDPLILHQHSAAAVFAYAAELPPQAERLSALWPGPLTLVLPRSPEVPDLVSAGLPTVALRVPAHPLMQEVLRSVAFPVAAPSANPFGFVSPVTAGHVNDQLGERIGYILDGGPCRIGLESTIVGFAGGNCTVLRRGGTEIERIEELLGERVAVAEISSSRPAAPGMLLSHYSPGVPLRLVDRIARAGDATTAAVCCGPGRPVSAHTYNLSPAGDLGEAARNLFPVLRVLAAGGYTSAIVERVEERGLGRAINDRLQRAAY